MDKQRLMELAGAPISENESNVSREQLLNALSTHIADSIVDWMKDDPEAKEELQEADPREIISADIEQHLEPMKQEILDNVVRRVMQGLGLNNKG